MKDTLKLGQLITEPQERDAVHMAIIPVIAGPGLAPGAHVGISEDGTASPREQHIGVVDPFLENVVRPGEKFWLFLFPGSITSLRHEWTHPAFADAPKADATPSEVWLRGFAARADLSYLTVLRIGREALTDGRAAVGGSIEQDDFNDVKGEFLAHAAVVLGLTPVDAESVYFSCSC